MASRTLENSEFASLHKAPTSQRPAGTAKSIFPSTSKIISWPQKLSLLSQDKTQADSFTWQTIPPDPSPAPKAVDFCSSQEHRRTFPLSATLVSGEASLAVAFHTSYMARAHFQRGPHPFPTQGAGVGGWPVGLALSRSPARLTVAGGSHGTASRRRKKRFTLKTTLSQCSQCSSCVTSSFPPAAF